MNYKTDVLVIGAGAIGICSAYYIRDRGLNVTVVEKGEVCSGSSYGNAGLIVPSHCVPLAAPGVVSKSLKWMFNPESPFYIKPRFNLELLSWLWRFRGACNKKQMQRAMPTIRDLSLASLELFEELAAVEDLSFCYEKKGMLRVYKAEKGLDEGTKEARLLQEIGIEVSVMNASEVRKIEPNFHPEVIGGIFFPQDAHLVPARFVRGLAQHLERMGGEIHTSTEVLGFETTGRSISTVKTTKGNFSARQIVLAGGAWSPGITNGLGLNLPIEAGKGYSITFKRPPYCPVMPITLADAKVGITPMGDTLRLAGTLELAGLDLSINTRRIGAILKTVPTYLPKIDPEGLELIEIWRGLRPCTPDGLPFLGRPRAYENLVVAAGHAMIGVSLSPVTGKLVSELVDEKEPSIDLNTLKVDRFD